MSNNLDIQLKQMIDNPDTSEAARAYLRDAQKRDPVDVANEIETMSKMLIARCETFHKHQDVDRVVLAIKNLMPNNEHYIWKWLAGVFALIFIYIFLKQFGL